MHGSISCKYDTNRSISVWVPIFWLVKSSIMFLTFSPFPSLFPLPSPSFSAVHHRPSGLFPPASSLLLPHLTMLLQKWLLLLKPVQKFSLFPPSFPPCFAAWCYLHTFYPRDLKKDPFLIKYVYIRPWMMCSRSESQPKL